MQNYLMLSNIMSAVDNQKWMLILAFLFFFKKYISYKVFVDFMSVYTNAIFQVKYLKRELN